MGVAVPYVMNSLALKICNLTKNGIGYELAPEACKERHCSVICANQKGITASPIMT